ncbi:hypothetical protein CDL15_Pgr000311 [Punica granatum]|uniref:Terpene synthase metal-binding domain-containing protein n=1 Tax=Punica granatum TaxID=22663 RepID=A0A218Y239_PUNGR|nr:hypothetical protein CDL15_Pgr000311 [Punica granatum]
MKRAKVEAENLGSAAKGVASPPPPPPLPPLLPRSWARRTASAECITNREIAEFWRRKRTEEEDHLLAAIKAAARVRARKFSDENQEGHDGSYVDYYMKENPSCSLEGARDHVKEMISDSWKSLNRECLFPHQFPPYMAKASLNTARMIPLMYEYDENHRLPRIEEYMKSLLLKRSA